MKKNIMNPGLLLTVIVTVIFLSSGTVLPESKTGAIFDSNDSLRFSSPLWNETEDQAPFSVFDDSGQTEELNRTSPDDDLIPEGPTEVWISYSVSGTELIWEIRGPGMYVGKCVTGSVESNVDLMIRFEGFDDLQTPSFPSKNLETYYSAATLDLPVEQLQWRRGPDFNSYSFLFMPKEAPATNWSLWSKVTVTNDLVSGRYSDHASIIFLIRNVIPWVEASL